VVASHGHGNDAAKKPGGVHTIIGADARIDGQLSSEAPIGARRSTWALGGTSRESMNGLIRSVWQVPAYLPYLQPPLTEDAVAETEQALGIRLPEEYLSLLREQNGGYVRLTLPDSLHSMIWGIGSSFPSITQECWALDPTNADAGRWAPRASECLIPFDGDGHWHLCFDYRGVSSPSVCFVDVATGEDSQVAPSFADFLARLRPEPDPNRLLLAQPASIDEAADALRPHLKAPFEPADSDAHGYPMRRCALGHAKDPQWAWLSPNEVPRGFVRRTDPHYAELSNLLPGTGLLLPDHPDAKVIVKCTEGITQLVFEACRRASFSILNE
jgi:hypothetical protein